MMPGRIWKNTCSLVTSHVTERSRQTISINFCYFAVGFHSCESVPICTALTAKSCQCNPTPCWSCCKARPHRVCSWANLAGTIFVIAFPLFPPISPNLTETVKLTVTNGLKHGWTKKQHCNVVGYKWIQWNAWQPASASRKAVARSA